MGRPAARFLNRRQRGRLLDSWAAAQEANPDVVICHPKSFGGPTIAEKLGVPAMLPLPQKKLTV